jgi:hypothetical protein
MNNFISAIGTFFIACQICSAQLYITLPVAYDSPIVYHDNYNHANVNYGDKPFLAAFEIPGAQGGVNTNRALLFFDLSQIPIGSTILSAKLNLYAYTEFTVIPVDNGHYGSNQSKLNRITSQWSENTVNWNTQPTVTNLNEVMLNQSIFPDQNYLDIDVKNLVQDMIDNPSNSFGFELSLVNEVSTTNLSFCSNDYPNTLKRPTLEIEYRLSVDVDEFSLERYQIAPNPTNNILNFTFENNTPKLIQFVDYNGKVAYSLTCVEKEQTISVMQLAAGCYTIQVQSESKHFPQLKIILLD